MSKYLYNQIEEYLLHIIKENKNTPNFILPSENQLALKFNVSRVSVRKAFSALEEKKLIYKIQGKGTLIRQNEKQDLFFEPEIEPFLIGFIAPDFSTGFPRNIHAGLSEYCNSIGASVITFCSFGKSSEEEKAINLIKKLNCKGAIIMPSDEDNYNNGILGIAMNKYPAVLVDRYLYGLNLSCIGSNHFDIGFNATTYLLNRNHKHISIITLTELVSAILERVKGYKNALNQKNITERYHLMLQSYTDEEILNMMVNFFTENPQITGFICNSGHLTTLLLLAMNKLNRKIEKDYELVLIDENSNELEKMLNVKIHTIVQDGYQIGYIAAKSLCDNLYHQKEIKSLNIPLLTK